MFFFRTCHQDEETDRTCQQVIRDNLEWCKLVTGHCTASPCMFEHVEGCIPAGVLNDEDSFIQMFLKVNRCPLKTHQTCLTHGNSCPISGKAAEVDFDVAGLPCWDYSNAGKRRRENGVTKKVFLSYAKRHVQQQTPLLIIENVKARLLETISEPPKTGTWRTDWSRIKCLQSWSREDIRIYLHLLDAVNMCQPNILFIVF